jgi:hypothetical protein
MVDTLNELFEGFVSEKSKIVAIEKKTPQEIFGTKSKMPADRKVILIRLDKGGRESHAEPKGMEYDEKSNEWHVLDKISGIRSVRNQNSWYKRFYDKYRTFPKVGMEIEATISPRGFMVIKV